MSLSDHELYAAHHAGQEHDREIQARSENDKQEVRDQRTEPKYAGWKGLENLKEAP